MLKRESRALPKSCGIETECGVIEPKLGPNANDRFVELIDPEWIEDGYGEVAWDPRERMAQSRTQPAYDPHRLSFGNKHWRRSLNRLLPNGARFYLDGSHAEISTPLCADPQMLVTWNRACYHWLDYFCRRYRERGFNFRIFRNNVAGISPYEQGSGEEDYAHGRVSYGSHLNLLVSREVPLELLTERSIPWFVLQTVIHGAGLVGAGIGIYDGFQISQRADFTFTESAVSTTAMRPIYNLRDDPYGNKDRFRRVHIIPFDSNMLELPEYLKIALNSIFFMMLEDGVLDNRFSLQNPVLTLHEISRDLSFRHRLAFANRKRNWTALDALAEYCRLFWDYLEKYHPDRTDLKEAVIWTAWIVDRLVDLDFASLYGMLDWPTKYEFIRNALDRKGKNWKDPLAYKLDILYHDNDHAEGLFFKKIQQDSRIVRVTTDAEIEHAFRAPPPTRSRWITEIVLHHYKKFVQSSDYWYRVSFLDGDNIRTLLFEPTTPWNSELAAELFALSLPAFVNAAVEKGIAKIEARPVPADYETDGPGSVINTPQNPPPPMPSEPHPFFVNAPDPIDEVAENDEREFRYRVEEATRRISFPRSPEDDTPPETQTPSPSTVETGNPDPSSEAK